MGSYQPSFDPQTRRIALPKKIRSYLAKNEIILSFGFEKCVFGYDPKIWERESARELQKPITQRSARDIRRFLFSAARSVDLDDQGRFVFPPDLLEYAKIRIPIVIGAGDHFEIWDQLIWDKYRLKVAGEI